MVGTYEYFIKDPFHSSPAETREKKTMKRGEMRECYLEEEKVEIVNYSVSFSGSYSWLGNSNGAVENSLGSKC